MSPAAIKAQIDFIRLSAEEPSSLYFEDFLRSGFHGWPERYQSRYPNLQTWTGVSELKNCVRRLSGAPNDWNVLLASRSLSLVRLAASCMFRVCRSVLSTDLSWPTYQQLLEQRALRSRNQVIQVPVREKIFRERWSANDVATLIAREYLKHRCDGIFLPAVDHLGIRLPIRRIVDEIQRVSKLRFCFIDAAQAFCQIPLDECVECADFLVAGSHKWLGAYLPIGIGLFGQNRTRSMIHRRLRTISTQRRIDDPFLEFAEMLEYRNLNRHIETVNLTPLMACSGASADRSKLGDIENRDSNREVNTLLDELPLTLCGYSPIGLNHELQSRIVVLESNSPYANQLTAEELRRRWEEMGYIVTAYADGRVRLSFPLSRA